MSASGRSRGSRSRPHAPELRARDDDLFRAIRDRVPYFLHHGIDASRFLPAPRLRDDAERADVVTPLLRLHEGPRVKRSRRRERFSLLQPGRGLGERCHELSLVAIARPHDEVRAERPGCLEPRRLWEAARHSHRRPRRQAPHRTDQPPRLRVGDMRHRARVHDVRVGLAHAVDDVEAAAAQAARNFLAVGQVELAAEREDRRKRASGHGNDCGPAGRERLRVAAMAEPSRIIGA